LIFFVNLVYVCNRHITVSEDGFAYFLTDVIKNAETAQSCPADSTIQAGVSQVQVWRDAKAVFSANLFDLHLVLNATSWKISQWRDNPACADAEHAAAGAPLDSGLHTHVEMAYAFTEACFEAFDVHMTDLQTGRANLADFAGVWRLLLWRHAGRRHWLGAFHHLQPRAGRSVQGFLWPRRHVWSGRMQRLPDVCRVGRHHSRRLSAPGCSFG
jgi:hypothetical protein